MSAGVCCDECWSVSCMVLVLMNWCEQERAVKVDTPDAAEVLLR